MKRENDQEPIQQLQQGWKQIDELGERAPLSVTEMKEQITVYKVKQKKAFYKELTIFLLTAVFILCAFIVSVFQVPILFVVIQVGAVCLAPIILYVLIQRKKNKEKLFI